MIDLTSLKIELENQFPEMTFSLGKRIYGPCIIAKSSKYSGADVYSNKKEIIIEAGIPEMKTRLLLGGGVIFLKLFNRNYSVPSLKIKEFLDKKYQNVKLRR